MARFVADLCDRVSHEDKQGLALFACEELDQDDCGKGDHKDISLAWCQKQGYTKVMDYANYTRKDLAKEVVDHAAGGEVGRERQAELGARHILTPPYTPRWNGKVERFHQTMQREWATGQRYRNSSARNQALPHWLRYYNERRPHSSLGGQPPITRAHNLPG